MADCLCCPTLTRSHTQQRIRPSTACLVMCSAGLDEHDRRWTMRKIVTLAVTSSSSWFSCDARCAHPREFAVRKRGCYEQRKLCICICYVCLLKDAPNNARSYIVRELARQKKRGGILILTQQSSAKLSKPLLGFLSFFFFVSFFNLSFFLSMILSFFVDFFLCLFLSFFLFFCLCIFLSFYLFVFLSFFRLFLSFILSFLSFSLSFFVCFFSFFLSFLSC